MDGVGLPTRPRFSHGPDSAARIRALLLTASFVSPAFATVSVYGAFASTSLSPFFLWYWFAGSLKRPPTQSYFFDFRPLSSIVFHCIAVISIPWVATVTPVFIRDQSIVIATVSKFTATSTSCLHSQTSLIFTLRRLALIILKLKVNPLWLQFLHPQWWFRDWSRIFFTMHTCTDP